MNFDTKDLRETEREQLTEKSISQNYVLKAALGQCLRVSG